MDAELNRRIVTIERRLAHTREREHKAHLNKVESVIKHAEATRDRLRLENELAELELQKNRESHL